VSSVLKKGWRLGEHFMMAFICAGVTLTIYMILLYSFEEKITCIPKHCAESSGVSRLPASSPSETRHRPLSTDPDMAPSNPSDVWTWEVRTSTDQRDASWIPSPAE
jgi:hypothetical protein